MSHGPKITDAALESGPHTQQEGKWCQRVLSSCHLLYKARFLSWLLLISPWAQSGHIPPLCAKNGWEHGQKRMELSSLAFLCQNVGLLPKKKGGGLRWILTEHLKVSLNQEVKNGLNVFLFVQRFCNIMVKSTDSRDKLLGFNPSPTQLTM